MAGIYWMISAAALSAFADAVGKHLTGKYDPVFLSFIRAAITLVIIAGWMLFHGTQKFKMTSYSMHLTRGFFTLVATVSGLFVVKYLSLIEATTISFTKPLFMVPIALFLLGEKNSIKRIVATIIGFTMAAPLLSYGSSAITLAVCVGLLGALSAAVVSAYSRKIAASDNLLTSLLTSTLFVVVFTLPGLGSISAVVLEDLPWIIMLGVLGFGIQASFTLAYSLSPATLVAPYEYTRAIFAAGLGMLFFSELPTLPKLISLCGIIGACLVVTQTGRRKREA